MPPNELKLRLYCQMNYKENTFQFSELFLAIITANEGLWICTYKIHGLIHLPPTFTPLFTGSPGVALPMLPLPPGSLHSDAPSHKVPRVIFLNHLQPSSFKILQDFPCKEEGGSQIFFMIFTWPPQPEPAPLTVQTISTMLHPRRIQK